MQLELNTSEMCLVGDDRFPLMYNLTLCRPDGLLIKYPQFPDVLKALNVQPQNIFLLTV